MKQRWALVAMGAWLMGTICTSTVASENFYTIDRLLAGSPNTAFTTIVQKLGQPASRDFLRYLSSELNRLYFQMWNVAQVALGLLILWLTAGAPTEDPANARLTRWCVIAMLASVVLMLGYLTPAIVSLGRELDFVPRDPEPAGMSRFWVLHAAYTSLEMLKLAAGVVVTFRIMKTAPPTPAA